MTLRAPAGTSFRSIAKKLKVSEGTVRNRVRRMCASGFLAGRTVIANPALLGLAMGVYSLHVSPMRSKQGSIDELRLVDGVISIRDHHGAHLSILFVYDNERTLRRRLSLFDLVTGADDGDFGQIALPPCPYVPTPRDWRLVRCLCRFGTTSTEELAFMLSTSTRTVKRSLSKLSRSGAILCVLNLDYRRVVSGIPANLIVRFATSRQSVNVEDEILEALGDSSFHAARWDYAAVYELIVPSPYVASHLAKRIAQIEGVEGARVELVDEHIDRTRALADYLPGSSTLEEAARSIPTARSVPYRSGGFLQFPA